MLYFTRFDLMVREIWILNGAWSFIWGIRDISLDLDSRRRCAASEDFVRWVRGALSDCIRISSIGTAWLLRQSELFFVSDRALNCLLGVEFKGACGTKTYRSCSVVDPQICKM